MNAAKTAGERFAFLFISGVLLYLLWVAWHLGVDYSDAYETFWNAKSILAHDPDFFTHKRPILYSSLFVPLFWVEKLTASDFAFQAAHIISILFLIAFFFAAYRFFRRHLDRQASWLTLFLLALNPIVIHLAPFAKEDIPGVCALVGAYYLFLKSSEKNDLRGLIAAGILMGVALDLRRSFHIVLPGTILIYEVLSGQFRKNWIVKLLTAFVLPVAFFFLMPAILYPVIGKTSLINAIPQFFTELVQHYRMFSESKDSPMVNFLALTHSVTWPILAAAVLGMITGVWRKQAGALFCTTWFITYFIFFTFIISHKEARYLIPVFPPIYFLAVLGILQLLELVKKFCKTTTSWRASSAVLGIFLIVSPAALGFRELYKFQDEFYREPFAKRVAMKAKALAGEHDIDWIGPLYATCPKDRSLFPGDNISYTYHVYHHVIGFFADKKPGLLMNVQLLQAADRQAGIFAFPQIARLSGSGNVLVLNLERDLYMANNLPNKREPLVVERIQTLSFHRTENAEPGVMTFESDDARDAKIRISIVDQTYTIEGIYIPDRRYELYLQIEGIAFPMAFNFVDVVDGKFETSKEKVQAGLQIENAMLLYYDSVSEIAMA